MSVKVKSEKKKEKRKKNRKILKVQLLYRFCVILVKVWNRRLWKNTKKYGSKKTLILLYDAHWVFKIITKLQIWNIFTARKYMVIWQQISAISRNSGPETCCIAHQTFPWSNLTVEKGVRNRNVRKIWNMLTIETPDQLQRQIGSLNNLKLQVLLD